MDPSRVACPNTACPAYGKTDQGTVVIHSRKERRFRCTRCRRPFAARRGTALFRLHAPDARIACVLTLLAYGCPLQAIVVAFGLDERTVARWQQRAGQHSQRLHERLVQAGGLDLGHVQADELWVKLVGQKVWQAMALAVPSRLWLGGVLSPTRDTALIVALVAHVRTCARSLAILVCVDGLATYVGAFRRAFSTPKRTGKRGRPPLVLAPGFLLGQVIKVYGSRFGRHVVTKVRRRAVFGTLQEIGETMQRVGGGQTVNTAFIERLNATFRQRLTPLVRRGRCLAHRLETVSAGMFLVGTVYNFCTLHDSLDVRLADGRRQHRTPAMAAGLTDHPWTVLELLSLPVYAPLPVTAPAPPRRGRPPKPRPAAALGGAA